MFIQLYIARLKCLFRNKQVIFWSFLFPIALASFYYFAFSNIYNSVSFKTISVAYVNHGENSDEFGTILKEIKLSEDTNLFEVTLCDEEEAKSLLVKGKIEAYMIGSEIPKLFVKKNGFNQTIVKGFLDTYLQRRVTIQNILQENPNAMNEGLLDDVMQFNNFIEEMKNQKKPDILLISYYALLAYTCIGAAFGGLDEIINIQANQSACGARVNISPMNKMKLFLCNLLASFTTYILSIMLLFFYMLCVLKINFGGSLNYLLLTCLLGSLTGLSVGATVGVWVKKKAEVKEAMLTAIVLGGSFLAGMMMPSIKYEIADKVPLLGYLNPVNLITDTMYSLYYYDTYERFYQNISVLCIMTVLLTIASYIGIRRKSYASI